MSMNIANIINKESVTGFGKEASTFVAYWLPLSVKVVK
jgi:hypothetical protein